MKFSQLFNGMAVGTAIVAVATLAGSGVARADGMERGKVVYDSPTSWSGVYVGLQGGYQWANITNDYVGAGATYDIDSTSAFAGVHLGLQHQWGNLVLGVEGNIIGMYDLNDDGAQPCANATFNCASRINSLVSIGPRIGWVMGKHMPYVTGGYANASVTQYANTAATGVLFEQSHARHDGWYLGGGLEWNISKNWFIGVEYRHYEFDTALHIGNNGAGALMPAEDRRIDLSSDSVSFRASWKFGRDEVVPLK